MYDVTAVIPTIPPRMNVLLPQAIKSVTDQTHTISAISIAVDTDRMGAWHTRARALSSVRTFWTAFIDDDDLWDPIHVEHLLRHAHDTDADYVFSWYHLGSMCSNVDLLPHFGREFDPANPHHTTMNVLVKTELAQSIGFTPPEPGARVGGEDWRFTLGCVAAGAKIVHLPERTWMYRCLPGNTSGLASRWIE